MMKIRIMLTVILVTALFAFFTAAQSGEKTKKKPRSKGAAAAGQTTNQQGTPGQGPPAAGPPPAPSRKPGKREKPERVGTLGDIAVDRVWLDSECRIHFKLRNKGKWNMSSLEHMKGVVRVYFRDEHEDFWVNRISKKGKKGVDLAGALKRPRAMVSYDTKIKLSKAQKVRVVFLPSTQLSRLRFSQVKAQPVTLTPRCPPAGAGQASAQGTTALNQLFECKNNDTTVFANEHDMIPIDEIPMQATVRPEAALPYVPCSYPNAYQLMRSCPTEEEIDQIRADFNIYFRRELIESGVLGPWSCTEGGHESSIMLSMYNTFRLAKCIPFDEPFPWAPEYSNLYAWLKSLGLTAIGYYDGTAGSGRDKRISLGGRNLNDPMYRYAVSGGSGAVYLLVLLIHEARHAGDGILHNCGNDDTNLEYMGAWAVQYYLLRMLAENTGDYFLDFQKSAFLESAERVLEIRFCDYEE